MNPARPAEPGRHQHVTGISQTSSWQWRRDSWIAVASGTGRVGCQVGESVAGDVHGKIVHSAIHTSVHNAIRLCPHNYPHSIVDTERLLGQSLEIVNCAVTCSDRCCTPGIAPSTAHRPPSSVHNSDGCRLHRYPHTYAQCAQLAFQPEGRPVRATHRSRFT